MLSERMASLSDKTGMRFGSLVVLERAPDDFTKSGERRVRWACRCDCGSVLPVRATNLASGNSKSCGCQKPVGISRSRRKPVPAGSRFGLLVVESLGDPIVSPSGRRGLRYWCRCDCGKLALVEVSNLKSGNSESCGCLLKESRPERALFAEVRSAYPEAVNRVRGLLRSSRMELDIWVPSLRAGVEFDGRGWHAFGDGPERDARKNRECAEAGIRLLRVGDREYKKDPAGETARVLSWLRSLPPA